MKAVGGALIVYAAGIQSTEPPTFDQRSRCTIQRIFLNSFIARHSTVGSLTIKIAPLSNAILRLSFDEVVTVVNNEYSHSIDRPKHSKTRMLFQLVSSVVDHEEWFTALYKNSNDSFKTQSKN
jgi:hypothetical protein